MATKTTKERVAAKDASKAKNLKLKDDYENANMGDFQNLYPLPRGVMPEWDVLMKKYDDIYNRTSKMVYEESIIGGGVGAALKRLEDGKKKENDGEKSAKKGMTRSASKVKVESQVGKLASGLHEDIGRVR